MHSGNKKSTYITIEAKCKQWKRYHLSKADRDYSTFKDANNRLRSLIRNLRCQHEANLVSDVANNPKRFQHK